jgi:hypothetical protein
MARTYQPSPATQRKTATTPLDTNGPDSFDAQDQRGENSRGQNNQGENNQVGDNTERRENLTAVQDQPDNDRDNSRRTPGDREFGKNRDERKQHDGYSERGSRREQPSTPSPGMDAFAPVLEAWTQVFKSWSELAETMVKAQQDAFASMISAVPASPQQRTA